MLADQHWNLLFAQIHIFRYIAAADKLVIHGLQCVHVHTVHFPDIGLVTVIFACVNLGVQVIVPIHGCHRHHMLIAAQLIQHLVVQNRHIGAGRAPLVVVDGDLGQIAPALQHGFVLGIAGNAQADHYDDGKGAHHHTDYRKSGAAFAAAKIIRAEAQQIRYLHLHPPTEPVSLLSASSSQQPRPQRPRLQRPPR